MVSIQVCFLPSVQPLPRRCSQNLETWSCSNRSSFWSCSSYREGSFQSDIMPCHGIQRHDTECARAALPGTICAECPPGAKQSSEEQRRAESGEAWRSHAKPCCHSCAKCLKILKSKSAMPAMAMPWQCYVMLREPCEPCRTQRAWL